MTPIKAIRTSLVPRLDKVHDLIVRTLGSSNPLMNRVVGHHLSHRGKELRPMLAILTSAQRGGAAGEEGEIAGRNAQIVERQRKSAKGDGTIPLNGKNGQPGNASRAQKSMFDLANEAM
ncbi:MAG: hypothetical protein K2F86_03150 [Duncaniella sp.]|nr:hypothetical protein [Duncaniella sp.]